MDQKLLYAFRGWIGFVAFMDIGTAIRCFMENRSFLGAHSLLNSNGLADEDATLPRILGTYSILKALALIHCTLFIHYKPVVSLGICSLVLTLWYYGLEVFYFGSTSFTFYVIFPSVLNGITLIGLIILPKRLLEPEINIEEDSLGLLKHPGFKRRRPKKIH